MKLKVCTTGKFTLKSLQPLVEEYIRRIHHYLPIEVTNTKAVKPDDFLIVLDERGESLTSIEFSKWLEDKKLRSVKQLVFLVGPAEGFTDDVRRKANFLLSLSKMTLQHELTLVVLLEQIYRACTILKGEPYHK